MPIPSSPASTAGVAMPTGAAVAIETITDVGGFAALRPEWDALLADSAADCVFLTWEWLYTWWKHLSRGRRLSLITARSGGELIAVAPFMVSPPRPSRLVPFRSVEFLGTGSVGSDYLDVIVRRGWEQSALDRLAAHLADRRRVLVLGQLRRDRCLATGLVSPLTSRGWETVERPGDVCPYIPLDGVSWPDYLASLTVGHRSNFKRRLNNLGKGFDLSFERADAEEQRRGALDAFVDLHALRWRERGGSTALYTPTLIAFHQEWSRLALERGWLRLFVLKLDGQPVAALYGVRHRGAFCFYQTGFDPGYARLGVGQVILGLAIKSAIEEGAGEFDLLHGDEPYKFDWARQVHQLGRIELYPPDLRGRLHHAMAELGRRARTTARRLLPQAITDRLTGGRGIGVRGASATARVH